MSCLLSVLIPAYNAERFLPACLDSILAQEFTDYEVVVVNDGSSDGSVSILEEYAPRFPGFQIIHQANAGFGAARNTGMRRARGTYVYCMDADDYLHPGLFHALAAKIHSFPYDTIFFGFRKQYIGHKHETYFDMIPPAVDCKSKEDVVDTLATLMKNGLGFGVWQQCIRAAAIQESGVVFPTLKREADIAFLLDFYPFVQHFTTLPQVYYQYQAYYTPHKNNPDILPNHIVLYRKMHKLFEDNRKETAAVLLRRYFVLWFCHVVPLHLLKNNSLSAKEKHTQWDILLHHTEVTEWHKEVRKIRGGGLLQQTALLVYGFGSVRMMYVFTCVNHFLKFGLKLNYKRLFYRTTT